MHSNQWIENKAKSRMEIYPGFVLGGNLYAVDRIKLSPPWKPISEDDKKLEEIKIQKVQ